MKNVVVLGSTGSVGRTTLEVIDAHRDKFRAIGLAARSGLPLIKEQIESFLPEVVAVYEETYAHQLRQWLSSIEGGPRGSSNEFPGAVVKELKDIRVLSGIEGLIEAATIDKADIVLSAIVGAAGLLPTVSALKKGKTIGLANKETLVIAGKIVTELAKRHSAKIIPVDSEHSALFQCLENRKPSEIRRLILTASGGPFRGKSREELLKVKVEDALKHPNWKMGAKITIDSATLMNKGFEVIEAHWLFGVPPERIEVVIHPESIIHSMVELTDGTIIAQLSRPDMKAPVAYALSYPERLFEVVEPLDFSTLRTLTFEAPDRVVFPCLGLAYSVLKAEGTCPAVLNAANEVAVEAFLKERIGFNDIPFLIEKVLERHHKMPGDTIEEVLEADRWARQETEELIRRML